MSSPRRLPSIADEDWLLHLSRTLSTTVRNARQPRLYRRIGDEAGVGLGEHLYLLFNRIAEYQPVRMATLAGVMDLDRSTVSRQVSELTAAGYIQRIPDPDDRRSFILLLTRKGEKALERVWQVWRKTLAEVTADWSEVDRDTFTRLFDTLAQALQRLSGSEDRAAAQAARPTWP